MTKKIIVVAGSTGDLGTRIVKALLDLGAEVRALVRPTSDPRKIKFLQSLGASIVVINLEDAAALTNACKGASCVVSALAGLRETIVDAQIKLVEAAIAAKVPRFIPSDYSLDFTSFSNGENRNLDLRREFHKYLDKAPIAATTIFNGAFTDMLTGQMPMVLFDKRTVIYWGNADHKLTFTSMDDTAAYTAHAALDPTTPRYLRIAGDQISAREIRQMMMDITGKKFHLIKTGNQKMLGLIIKIARTFSPSENELYPAWQGMQYMHNMIDKRSELKSLDNDRYPTIKWTKVKDILAAHVTGK